MKPSILKPHNSEGMIMNKTAIKNFAIWAREKLMSDIRTRLGFVGITEQGVAAPLDSSTKEIQY